MALLIGIWRLRRRNRRRVDERPAVIGKRPPDIKDDRTGRGSRNLQFHQLAFVCTPNYFFRLHRNTWSSNLIHAVFVVLLSPLRINNRIAIPGPPVYFFYIVISVNPHHQLTMAAGPGWWTFRLYLRVYPDGFIWLYGSVLAAISCNWGVIYFYFRYGNIGLINSHAYWYGLIGTMIGIYGDRARIVSGRKTRPVYRYRYRVGFGRCRTARGVDAQPTLIIWDRPRQGAAAAVLNANILGSAGSAKAQARWAAR